MSRLAATHLQKSIRKKCLVRDVSFRLDQGEIVGLLGPNGAGKTTSFYLMIGLLTPDKGVITLDDTIITHLPIHARARLGLGYLPQEPSVFRQLTVSDNILAILELQPHLTPEDRRQRLTALLEQFQLQDKRKQMGITLSGGERRRTEMARALAMNPRFLFLDEPFAGVDPLAVLDIKQHLKALQRQGIGIFITDHHVRETLSICERAYILHEGHVLIEGDPQTIACNPMVREVYLGNHFTL